MNGDNPKKRPLTCKEIFGLIDKNNDGVISTDEFMSCLDMIHLELTANEKILLTREVDKNRDDRINIEEISYFLLNNETGFIEISGLENSISSFRPGSLEEAVYKVKLYIKNNLAGQNTLENVFLRLDEHKTGSLNDSEFDISLDRLKLSFSPAQKKSLKQLGKFDSEGKILYKDFYKTICEYEFKAIRSFTEIKDEPIVPSNILTYKIKPETDYFTRNNSRSTTILNSEQAALVKCKELYSACTKFIDPDFGPEQGHNGDICLY